MEPKVGVGVFVFNTNQQIILGRRKGSHGAGTWALPGGHLDFGESFESCAIREVMEETGLEIENIHFLTATNDVMLAEGKHYVTVFVGGIIKDPKTMPEVLEPEKCEGWEYVDWNQIKTWALNEIEESGIEDEGSKRRMFKPLVNLCRERPSFDPCGLFRLV